MNESEDRLPVQSGEEFEISLAETPSNGHDWQLVTCPGGIEFIANSHVRPADDARSVGGSGAHVFRFQATAAGTYAISFVLKRPWEKRAIGRRVFQVHVSD
jgi:predicted secreted protein